jgi:hypothetical protein
LLQPLFPPVCCARIWVLWLTTPKVASVRSFFAKKRNWTFTLQDELAKYLWSEGFEAANEDFLFKENDRNSAEMQPDNWPYAFSSQRSHGYSPGQADRKRAAAAAPAHL